MLRTVTDADLLVFFADQADPQACAMTASVPREWAVFTAHWAMVRVDPEILVQTIDVRGAAAGYITRFRRFGMPEVGYWLGRRFWGRGIATAALEELLAACPERPLFARVAKVNAASLRVVQKAGFEIVAEETYTNRAGEVVAEYLLRLDAGVLPHQL